MKELGHRNFRLNLVQMPREVHRVAYRAYRGSSTPRQVQLTRDNLHCTKSQGLCTLLSSTGEEVVSGGERVRSFFAFSSKTRVDYLPGPLRGTKIVVDVLSLQGVNRPGVAGCSVQG